MTAISYRCRRAKGDLATHCDRLATTHQDRPLDSEPELLLLLPLLLLPLPLELLLPPLERDGEADLLGARRLGLSRPPLPR